MSSTHREGPNPLRPYYVSRPDIGLGDGPPLPNSTSKAPNTTSPSFRSSLSARDIFSDLDYSDYLSDSSPSAGEILRAWVDQAIWKYTSVLLAQPFELAKVVLQCHVAGVSDIELVKKGDYEDDDLSLVDDSQSDEDDEPAYFTSSAPRSSRPSRYPPSPRTPRTPRTPKRPAKSRQTSHSVDSNPHKLKLRYPPSLLDAISQLWQREGAWGVWKGTNTTFMYGLLFKTIETWTRGFLAAVANIPDPGMLPAVGVSGVDVADSPYAAASLGIVIAAAGIAGVLLAPLDMVRTKLMLTSSNHTPRSPIPLLRRLPHLSCPPALITPTILHSTLPALVTTSTPLLLRSRAGVDPIASPNAYSVFRFIAAAGELCVRLPLETVLRRAQVQIGSTEFATHQRKQHVLKPESWMEDRIVDIGEYKGPLGTMWYIAREEGSRVTRAGIKAPAGGAVRPDAPMQRKKGQGVGGLFRGWRVGMWGLGGMWAAAMLGGVGGAGKGGEF